MFKFTQYCSGGFDDHMSVTNGRMKSMDDPCNCWKYISVLLLTVTGDCHVGI